MLREAEEREIADAAAALPGNWTAECGEADELGPDMCVTFIRVRDLGQVESHPIFAVVRSAREIFVAALAANETCATAPVRDIAQALRIVRNTVRCLSADWPGSEADGKALRGCRETRPAAFSRGTRRPRR